MQSKLWTEAIRTSADPPRAAHYLALLRSGEASASLRRVRPETARILAALWSGSQALSELLVAHADWLAPLLRAGTLEQAKPVTALRKDLERFLAARDAGPDPTAPLDRIRQFKQRETLRIAARDLARLSDASEITRELSDLADVCLETVHDQCRQQWTQRLGEPWHQDADGHWQPTPFCILGLGKLGGRELNYSSDVDLLFVYGEEGHVFKDPPRPEDSGKGLTNHQFFKRLTETLVAEVGRLTPAGMLYRVDMRLRPEGNAGPLARSLPSYESYYWQWGQTWERMMLIKARRVAGDTVLAGEFLEVIQAFRYPRGLRDQALRDIARMKHRIETEVVRTGELDRNVKLGRGGIREIEFVAQSLQMLNAGRQPFLAHPQTLPTLDKLAEYHLLSPDAAGDLAHAYLFLRDVEHRLQMENNLQTHTIPTERQTRQRIARLMAFDTLDAFEAALDTHRHRVREIYETCLTTDGIEAPNLPELQGAETEWKSLLARHAFRDPDQALRLAQAFVLGPGFGHVSSRTQELARQLLGRLLAWCPRHNTLPANAARRFPDGDPSARWLSDPDRVLARLDTFVGAYGGRALLFETWTTNPSLFELIVFLFDRSEFLAETAIRTPDLVDELELSGYLRRSKTADQILRELRHGREDDDQRRWLRRYHQTERMRIGLRDILGLADSEQSLIELSALAEACLQYALEVLLARHRARGEPIAIIGLGKLGGAELNYGSDLDLMFVADDTTRDLPGLQRVAVDLIEMLSSMTEWGVAFILDTRLRPDGEKGLLVNPLKTYKEYYLHRAQLWEIQAISRSRPVAGSTNLGRLFQQTAAALTDFSRPANAAAAARNPDWRQEIARMRLRIERERTPKGKETLALKTGAGGLIDAEFIAQTLCLEHGWQEPNTLRALERARTAGALPADAAAQLIENYRRLRRVEAILRRWSYEGETELPDDPAPLYRVAVRCGFTTAEDFMAAIQRYRSCIRAVYDQVFPKPAGAGEKP
ncbi:MAG TPA: bifunctional [glutamate--ammonia ligase]-adenylyl-L-tyrosine phosphorylase/[glutamate--ammonia-ligase] adenylyltransferase [Verrucomicrobiota bacterium]|nr:bifunctional [glutamate--ammonia ligase]-adenylyl-L-tyrosine phosphorylase/[glutamate--ammonia-ligase] adenylyltransferase [Verrucomicrobiota bacterium]HNU52276.1 bifunctional [glutamate--ammonia ligase]-adenylyl-L-tyrosine phosphorylase/[glutamate--ammonia-ligase] adenylyltransferase [Verrucomicrobiota bacterium]